MKLSQVKSGRVERPLRVTLYGPEGIGKSTFAACAPKPIFLGPEDGSSELDVARYAPEDWEGLRQACHTLERDEHDYKTVVLDTADWIEPICWAWVCKEVPDDKGKKHDKIASYPYGKGYDHAFEQWRLLLALLDRLRDKKGMHVIVLAHSAVKSFKNPAGEDYERFELKLHKLAAALIKEWSDALLFADYQTHTLEQNKRTKGISTGARVMYTERRAPFDAKNRYQLPFEMALSWDDFFAAARTGASPAPILKALEDLAPRLPAEVLAVVERGKKQHAHNARELAKIENWARTKAAPQENKEHGTENG